MIKRWAQMSPAEREKRPAKPREVATARMGRRERVEDLNLC